MDGGSAVDDDGGGGEVGGGVDVEVGGEVEVVGEDEDDDAFKLNFDLGEGGLGQHGPIQLGNWCLSFDDLKPEHFMWSHLKQDVHWTQVVERFLVQMAHFQTTGPGLDSIPARISWSRRKLAGRVFSFVELIKNSDLQSDGCTHCQCLGKT